LSQHFENQIGPAAGCLKNEWCLTAREKLPPNARHTGKKSRQRQKPPKQKTKQTRFLALGVFVCRGLLVVVVVGRVVVVLLLLWGE
jgi:cell division septal protein FtsQ